MDVGKSPVLDTYKEDSIECIVWLGTECKLQRIAGVVMRV